MSVLNDYLHHNNLMPLYQSAYRKCHSTETALLEIISNMFSAINDQRITLLSLLDMSCAFDCVNHEILLGRLRSSYGISGVVLQWIESFLTGRTQQVNFSDQVSNVGFLRSGVPQGSVLGPLLFLLYTSEVPELVNKYKFYCHGYADDIQICASCYPSEFTIAVEKVVGCIQEVNERMGRNRLKLNLMKTQFLLVGT